MYKTFQAVQEEMYDIFNGGDDDNIQKKVEGRLFILHYLLNLEIVNGDDIEKFIKFSYQNYELLAEQFKKNYKEEKDEPIFSMSGQENTVN